MNSVIAEWYKAHSDEVIEPTQKIWAHPTDLNAIMHHVHAAVFLCFGTMMNTPGHHWSRTACSGIRIGHKGALFTGKCFAQCGYDLIKDLSLVAQCWAELRQQ